jgi:DNA polymerase III subunit gamma/tau
MSYQVLARRLRPRRFDEVVGQDHVTRTLQAAIAAGRVAHAFLFTGPRGVGKTTTARILAKALNCEAGLTAEPCNQCSTCREIADGQAFDVLEIDGASHTQVDKMRDLMETVAHRPLKSRFKVYIIDEVHMLSQHSFNALLKTLEEPPPHVKFIFATTDAHKVLSTVVSRCQRYDLRRIGLGELTSHLRAVAIAEGATLSDESLALVAREAEGSLRDAQSLLEQVLAATGKGAATDEAVRTLLGAADRRLVVGVMDGILAGDAAACLRALSQLYAHGYDAQRFCRDLLEHCRHLAALRATGDRRLVADLPEAEIDVLARQCELRSADDLQRFFRLLLEADEALSTPARTIDPQLVLEMYVLRVATLPPLLPVEDILRQLAALRGSGPLPPAASPPGSTPVRSAAAGVVSAAPRAASAAATPAPTTGPAAPAAVPIGDAGFWERFIARIRQEKLSIYLQLANAKCLAVEANVVRIGLDNEAMRRDLASREVLDRLQKAASDLLARRVEVQIGPLPAEHAADAPLARDRRRREETLSDPRVQAAQEIFGAEVRGVRDRRSE